MSLGINHAHGLNAKGLVVRHGLFLSKKQCLINDCLLTTLLVSEYRAWVQTANHQTFSCHCFIQTCVTPSLGDDRARLGWFKHVRTVYTAMNWGNQHWVGLLICLDRCHINIFDPFLSLTSARKVVSLMSPICKMLPYVITYCCDPADLSDLQLTEFSYSRLPWVPQNTRSGDCGPFSVKLIELHAHGMLYEGMKDISQPMVNNLRLEYALA